MSPAEIREEIIDILSDIAPDEDLSTLNDEQSFFRNKWSWIAWTSWTSLWSCANDTAFRFQKKNTNTLPQHEVNGRISRTENARHRQGLSDSCCSLGPGRVVVVACAWPELLS